MFKHILAAGLIGLSFNAMAADEQTQTQQNANKTQFKMSMPKPIENKVYESMIGTWETVAPDMAGTGKKERSVMKITWGPNHQFLVMNVKATGIEVHKTNYEGIGIFGIDSKGKAKSWWFDSWGADAMSTGTGDFGDNTLTVMDSNANFKETRSFELKGRQMIMHAKGTITMDGKETPFDVTTTYKKK